MENVKIIFPTKRFAYIDGEKSGHTNEVLRVEAGTHIFTLGNVANYKPAYRKVAETDTTVFEPLKVVFSRKRQGEAYAYRRSCLHVAAVDGLRLVSK